jgi:hypothetical protein
MKSKLDIALKVVVAAALIAAMMLVWTWALKWTWPIIATLFALLGLAIVWALARELLLKMARVMARFLSWAHLRLADWIQRQEELRRRHDNVQ